MIKPKALKKGDKVAIVSLSSGLGGEEAFLHRYRIGAARLQEEFGLVPVAMPNALRGIDYLDKNPKARAEDFMQAFEDADIRGVFSMIGGNDAIRLLPYVNFDTIKKNPKVFMGFSDTTINHFMMHNAGVASFYGPAILEGFAENGAMHAYTKQYVQQVLFDGTAPLPITTAPGWTSEMLDWAVEENNAIPRKPNKERREHELLQGRGKVQGRLLGGCLDVFQMLFGTWGRKWKSGKTPCCLLRPRKKYRLLTKCCIFCGG